MIDPSTLVFALGASEAMTSASLLIMLRKKQEPALLYWIISKGMIAIGLLSLFFRGWVIPDELSVVLTNVCLIGGYAILWAAARIFMRRKLHLHWHLLPSLFGICVTLYFLFGFDSAGYRTTISSLIYMSFSTLYAFEFLRKNKIEPHTFTQRYIGGLMLLNSVFFLYFSYLVKIDSMRPGFFDQPAFVLQFIWIFSLFIGIAHTVAAVAAVFERQHLKLSDLYEKEQILLEDKENTLLTLSHEFRNPVTAIDRGAQLLQMSKERESPEFNDRLHDIRTRAGFLHELLDHFTMSELGDVGRTDKAKQALSLYDVKLQLIQAFPSTDQLSRLNFSGDCNNPMTVYCFPGELTIALRNLIHNALKYSPEETMINLYFYNEGDLQIFRIEDSGMGIDPDEIKLIQQKFYRSKKVHGIEGSGLGLSVVNWVADLHGGSLDIESTPGRGTIIELSIPAM